MILSQKEKETKKELFFGVASADKREYNVRKIENPANSVGMSENIFQIMEDLL